MSRLSHTSTSTLCHFRASSRRPGISTAGRSNFTSRSTIPLSWPHRKASPMMAMRSSSAPPNGTRATHKVPTCHPQKDCRNHQPAPRTSALSIPPLLRRPDLPPPKPMTLTSSRQTWSPHPRLSAMVSQSRQHPPRPCSLPPPPRDPLHLAAPRRRQSFLKNGIGAS